MSADISQLIKEGSSKRSHSGGQIPAFDYVPSSKIVGKELLTSECASKFYI